MSWRDKATPVQGWRDKATAEQADPNRPSRLYENLIGYGEVDTFGERLGQNITALAGNMVEGMASAAGLFGDVQDLAAMGLDKAAEYVGLDPQPNHPFRQMGPRFPSGAELRQALSNATGGVSETSFTGPHADALNTGAEFAGSAALMGGPTLANLLKYGALSGFASEKAGAAVEDTPYEPYARIAAAIAAPMVFNRAVSPFGGADPVQIGLADDLASYGVKPTAGQRVGSEALRATEGVLAPTTQQMDDFTSAAMRTIGSNSSRATGSALREARDAIVRQMDDAVSGVSVIPNTRAAQAADDLLVWYDKNVTAGSRAGTARAIVSDIRSAVSGKQAFTLRQLKEWRTDLGRMTTSPDRVTREMAHGIRKIIDDLTDQALVAAGREADIPALAEARLMYQNYLAIRDTASRAGADMRRGILNPEALRGAIRRTQGPDAVALDQGTDLARLSTAGEAVLERSPTVQSGGIRHDPAVSAAVRGGGAGGATFATTGDPVSAISVGATAAALPRIARALANNPAGQWYLSNQAVNPNVMDKRLLASIAAALSERGQ